MNGQTKPIDRETPAARGVDDRDDIVSGHLAARRRERRLLAICSVLVVCGLLMLGGMVLADRPLVHVPFTSSGAVGH